MRLILGRLGDEEDDPPLQILARMTERKFGSVLLVTTLLLFLVVVITLKE